MLFDPVSPDTRDLVQTVERAQLDFWRDAHILDKTLSTRADGPRFVFYEGPPTANGQPGIHHVLARAFKDLFPRYKVMRGYRVVRKAGWDTHGLPVEIAVQKELGLENKAQVAAYGVDKFNAACREWVLRNIDDWRAFTERMGYWVDLDAAYITYHNDYIQSVWWTLKQLWAKGLLYRGFKVVPYSPASGTPLSTHELALGYKEVNDPSVYVRFPLQGQPGVAFMAWTTTPWTLPSNAALAVAADVDYVQVEGPVPGADGSEQLILAEALVARALTDPEHYRVVRRMKGRDLVGLRYERPYTFMTPPNGEDHGYVVAADYVSDEDGTGIVHTAPAYGADDMATGDKHTLPVFMAVNAEGVFVPQAGALAGLNFKEADKPIMRDLQERGLLYRRAVLRHDYPHDWRTGTPLMYFARETWFIRATEHRDDMVALNQTIHWTPEHIRDGRFGNWLADLKDWALGRERFWGTPLPVWVDEQTGETLCVGSVAELSALAGRDLSDLDLHRPYVDDITFPNPNGGGTMRRVPEVIDVWYDSGAMPYAQWGYPAHNTDVFEGQFPADYICEAVDQTRGWFYSLHAIAAMVSGSVAYRNVICLGHILDEQGQKMSKSKGNVVDPWSLMNSAGADALRWYLFTAAAPGEARRFAVGQVHEVVAKVWLTLWNTYSFFVTYANIDGWTPASTPSVAERDPLDRWLLAELNLLTKTVTQAYEDYDVPSATRPVQAFIDVLSNWYLRLSRRRFWRAQGDNDADKHAAYATLYEALVTVVKLLAPPMPFLSEAIYRNLVGKADADAPESVHLAAWPTYDDTLIDAASIHEMRVVQKLVGLGRAVREKANIGVRQPLALAQFVTRERSERAIVDAFAPLIMSELNVKQVLTLDDTSGFVTLSLNPLPRVLGPRLGTAFPAVQKQLKHGDAEAVRAYAQALLRGESITLEGDGTVYTLTPDEVQVVQTMTAEGVAFAEEGGYVAALNTTLTDALVAEGLAREVVRRVQDLRKEADYALNDTITVHYVAEGALADAIAAHRAYIMGETLALALEPGLPADADGYQRADFANGDAIRGQALSLAVRRA